MRNDLIDFQHDVLAAPRVFGDIRSGNCYKIALLLRLMGRPFEWVAHDVMSGVTREPAFLARNPNGKLPVLELPDGAYLWESNAILNYLAEGTPWLPAEPLSRARVLQWQFFEQYSHEPFIAVARFIAVFEGLPEARRAEYESRHPGGYKALAVMEAQLARTPFLAGDTPTIADISLYAYTHVAHEGGFDLSRFPAILAWLVRIATLPGYASMDTALVRHSKRGES
jgi:glutathione S-transferase